MNDCAFMLNVMSIHSHDQSALALSLLLLEVQYLSFCLWQMQ